MTTTQIAADVALNMCIGNKARVGIGFLAIQVALAKKANDSNFVNSHRYRRQAHDLVADILPIVYRRLERITGKARVS